MRHLFLILSLYFIPFILIGQEITYFDSNWIKVKNKKKASYYRVQSFNEKENLFYVEDYYKDGNSQMKGTLLSIKPEIKHGNFIYWYKNGQISSKKNFIQNKLDGLCQDWDSLGNLSSEKNYSWGKFHGEYKEWYSNGQIKNSCMYSNDELNGLVESFYYNGKRLRSDYYKLGELVEGMCFDENGNEVEYFPYMQLAKFNNGDTDEFRKYVTNRLIYPLDAQKKGLQGRVVVRFIVEKSGEISNVQIEESSNEIFNKSAIRAVKYSPKWTPGKKNNELVRTSFSIPVIYMLR